MYVDHYGFTAIPFNLSPDEKFFFGSEEHNKALAYLEFGISQGEGIVIVTGEIGAGKTTLVEHLLSVIDKRDYVVGRLVTTQLDSYDTIRMVAASFGIPHEKREKSTLILELKQLFERLHTQHKRALLIVDEAQSLTGEAVEELRMLSNLQTGGKTSFQLILLGQPEFKQLLASPGFEQVRQRVAASCHLGPLSAKDTCLYIEHRLNLVGWQNDPRITDGAFAAVYGRTAGIPRRINTLFARLLLLGFLDEKHEIDRTMVDAVARELAGELGIDCGEADTARAKANAIHVAKANGDLEAVSHDPSQPPEYLERRLVQIEQNLDRHHRVITRALDVAVHMFDARQNNVRSAT